MRLPFKEKFNGYISNFRNIFPPNVPQTTFERLLWKGT